MFRPTLIASHDQQVPDVRPLGPAVLIGILCALGAGLMWGFVFVTPLLLADYPGLLLSFGRYLAFGLIALLPAWLGRRSMAVLSRADWLRALQLTFVGNLLYYALLASAIQLADAPLPTMLIATLPVTIAVCSNWLPGQHGDTLAWRRLLPPVAIILAGLLLVNAGELSHANPVVRERSLLDYASGCLLAVGAVAAWTWYPIANARHLKAHPRISPSAWSSAQGLAALPLALIGLAGYGVYDAVGATAYDFPFGPRPALFIGMMFLIGLTASWLGTLLWNKASRHLPTSLAGQLIVFETLFAMLYVFTLRGELPSFAVAGGMGLLCCGVIGAIRAFGRRA